MADTKALFNQRFDAARTALTAGDEPAAAESLHWAIVTARSDPSLRRQLASALFNLGKLSRKFGRAGEAEAGPLLTEALTISEELFGSKDAALAPVLHELSRLYLQQSQHERAADALERLLVVARVKGEEHPDVATALSDLAFVKRKLGDDASAEALYRDALRIREKVLEPNNMVIVGTMERLSETCAARGNFVEALALLQRALPAREAALGPGHERVRAARSRVAELELQMAVAADTAAAAEARATKGAKLTPAWLKRLPDAVADTPSSTHAPSPINSKKLEFLGDSEPRALRPVPRPRDRSKTPAVAAAAVAASFMASLVPTPAASQIVISPPESARPFGRVTGLESGAAYRDIVRPDAPYRDTASDDAAFDDRRSTIAPERTHSPGLARRKRTGLYASAGAAAVTITIAGMLMLRPRAGKAKGSVATEISAAPPTTAAAPVVTKPATRTVSTATGAAAAAAARRADSLRAVSAAPANSAAVIQPDQRAQESAMPEIRAPRVDLHLDAIKIPSTPAAPNVDAMLRSAIERQRAPDTERIAAKAEVSPRPASPDVENAHTSPKLIGRVPDPGFPDALLRSGPHEGEVVVRFIVNELGRVDVASMVVEQSDHELFTAAVRDILPRFRFEPAHTLAPDSKPVSAWVSVPFRFTTKKK
jgi:TonB family protein